MRTLQSIGVVSSIAIASLANAQNAVQWRPESGGNGHWYKLIIPSERISKIAAEFTSHSIGGTLCSIGSEQENEFVFALSSTEPNRWTIAWPGATQITGPWLGGSYTNSIWTWGDGTPWSYTHWWAGEPNYLPSESALLFMGPAGGSPTSFWNNIDPLYPNWGFVVEWSFDCSNDGIVDYGQCRDGSLADYNSNNIPDCCELGTQCTPGNYAVQWRVEDGGNGHWYELIVSNSTVTWSAADAHARARGGLLACITSAAENSFVRSINPTNPSWRDLGPWLGGFQSPNATEPGGGWSWVSGEAWTWAEWTVNPVGEPNNAGCGPGNEDRLHFVACGTASPHWNDIPASGTSSCCGSQMSIKSHIIEWSADCNNDGIVDYGQIRSGQLADADGNNIPDSCEDTLFVPSQFPTIQAAIDSVPIGMQKTIQVASGIYNESFSLNGKGVVVRGAPNRTTILDGSGLTTSIARFTGGEPTTAGVEGLVFRNGTVGSQIYPKAPFRVGGAIYAALSSAFIRQCEFRQNTADFGGAIYAYMSRPLVEDSLFTGNSADEEGGAMQCYESTATIRGCDFNGNSCGSVNPGSGSSFKSVGALTAGETVLLENCTFTNGTAGVNGSAVEHYENYQIPTGVPGVIRIVNCDITGNLTANGAAGLRSLGRMNSCVVGSGTIICGNSGLNVEGPFLIEGSVTICDCLSDIARDGSVNGGDLGMVLSSWGIAGPQGIGDVNHDGVVNGADLGQLLSNWGPCP